MYYLLLVFFFIFFSEVDVGSAAEVMIVYVR